MKLRFIHCKPSAKTPNQKPLRPEIFQQANAILTIQYDIKCVILIRPPPPTLNGKTAYNNAKDPFPLIVNHSLIMMNGKCDFKGKNALIVMLLLTLKSTAHQSNLNVLNTLVYYL
jgi:hypothetical protein